MRATQSPKPAVRRLAPTDCHVVLDGTQVEARAGETVAATVLAAGRWMPFQCGMGACFCCLVTIDGRADRRACVERTHDGMIIKTGDGSRA